MLREKNNELGDIKSNLIKMVNESSNEDLLVQATQLMQQEDKADWWDELPTEQQKRIKKALKSIDTGKGFIEHKEVIAAAQKRLKKQRK